MSYIRDDCIENDRLVQRHDHQLVPRRLLRRVLDAPVRPAISGRTTQHRDDQQLARPTAGDAHRVLGQCRRPRRVLQVGRPPAAPARSSSSRTRSSVPTRTPTTRTSTCPPGYDVTCSGNTMVWLGAGAVPRQPAAVLHPHHGPLGLGHAVQGVGHRASRCGHRSRGLGRRRARSTRATPARARCGFPITLSAPPGAGKTVSVYWATAQGTAGSSDYTFKKGKTVFTRHAGDQDGDRRGHAGHEGRVQRAHVPRRGRGRRRREPPRARDRDDRRRRPGFRCPAPDLRRDGGRGRQRHRATSSCRSRSPSRPPPTCSVHYATVAGSASAAADYSAKTGTIKIAQGQAPGDGHDPDHSPTRPRRAPRRSSSWSTRPRTPRSSRARASSRSATTTEVTLAEWRARRADLVQVGTDRWNLTLGPPYVGTAPVLRRAGPHRRRHHGGAEAPVPPPRSGARGRSPPAVGRRRCDPPAGRRPGAPRAVARVRRARNAARRDR